MAARARSPGPVPRSPTRGSGIAVPAPPQPQPPTSPPPAPPAELVAALEAAEAELAVGAAPDLIMLHRGPLFFSSSLPRLRLLLAFAAFAVFLGVCALISSLGPAVLITAPAGVDGAAVPLLSPAQTCSVGPDGSVLAATTPYCWSHTFTFTSVLIQHFDVQLAVQRGNAGLGLPVVAAQPLLLLVTWYGLPPGASSDWSLLYNGSVTRTLHCADSVVACTAVSLFSTDAVAYTSYFVQLALPAAAAAGAALSGAPLSMDSASFSVRFRNVSFSVFELAFKSVFFWTSVAALVAFLRRAGCGCGRLCRFGDRCCKPAGASFQREQAVGWMQLLLVGLALFNEPLLGFCYAAPARAGSLLYVSVAFQLSFVALLLAFWLVEFGLLAAHASFETTSPLAFYFPKLVAVSIYYIMALAAYGWLIVQQQSDPMFDWSEFAYDSLQSTLSSPPGGNPALSAQLFFVVWSGALAGLYLVYLAWLLVRSAAAILSFSLAERCLFGLHFVVLVATALGLGAGAIYEVDVGSSLNLLFFNALFNGYVLLLAFLYTPEPYRELNEGAAAATGAPIDSPARAPFSDSAPPVLVGGGEEASGQDKGPAAAAAVESATGAVSIDLAIDLALGPGVPYVDEDVDSTEAIEVAAAAGQSLRMQAGASAAPALNPFDFFDDDPGKAGKADPFAAFAESFS